MKPLVACLVIATAVHLAAAPARAQDLAVHPDSAAAKALMEQPVGDDPSQAFGWLEVLRLWLPRGQAQHHAKRGLFDLYLRQAAGESWPKDATLGSTVQAGALLRDPTTDPATMVRWIAAQKRQLVALPLREVQPLPDALEPLAQRARQQAPGVWWIGEGDKPERAAWLVDIRHQGNVAVPAHALTLVLMPAGASPIGFVCDLGAGASDLMRPGDVQRRLCRSVAPVDGRRADWGEAVGKLARGEPVEIGWQGGALYQQQGYAKMLETLARASPPRMESIARRFIDCESRGNCPRRVALETPAPAANTTTKTRLAPMSSTRRDALLAAAAIAAFMAFCAAARLFGERVALLVPAAASLVACGWYFAAHYAYYGAAVAFLVPACLMITAAVLAVVFFVYRVYASFFFAPRPKPQLAIRP